MDFTWLHIGHIGHPIDCQGIPTMSIFCIYWDRLMGRLRLLVTSPFNLAEHPQALFSCVRCASMRPLHSDRRSTFAIFRKSLWLPNDHVLEQSHKAESIAHQHKTGYLIWYILPLAILSCSCAFALILRFAFLHARYARYMYIIYINIYNPSCKYARILLNSNQIPYSSFLNMNTKEHPSRWPEKRPQARKS